MGAISTFTLRGIVWRAIVKTRIVFLLFVYYSSHSKSCHPIRALIESHHYSQVCDVSGRTMRVCHISIQAAFFFTYWLHVMGHYIIVYVKTDTNTVTTELFISPPLSLTEIN